jgi:HEAT repeat protein
MHGAVHKLAALALCFCCAALSGCSFFNKKPTPEQVLHIKTPDDRMKELRELAKTAKKKSPEEQQRIVDDLSKQIQQEAEPPMRRQILRTLANYPQPAATAVIAAGLNDGDMETRRVACASMGKRGGKEAVQELTRVATSDTNPDVRLAAIRAMGLTKDAAALMPLTEAMGDADPAMQARAHESLVAVSGRDFGNDAKAWRDYAMTGKAESSTVSIAERLRRLFY